MAGHSAGTNPIKSHIAHRNDIEGGRKSPGDVDSIDPHASRSPFFSFGSGKSSPRSPRKFMGNARICDTGEDDDFSSVVNPAHSGR